MENSKFAQYKPLTVILALALLMAAALSGGHAMSFGQALMGLFLCLLSALQLFDRKAFAVAFAKYDLVADSFPLYGEAYPFIELVLGLAYLSGAAPLATNIVMLAIMIVGTAGVLKAIRSGAKIQCACAGTAFTLPVGRVTVFENAVMGLMAAVNIFELLR
jgi:hypothetical protein